jgi:uncharacterized membrane protein (DUF2068 family)
MSSKMKTDAYSRRMPARKAQAKPKPSSGGATILLIAAFKLIKGFLLLAVGIGALHFLHHDLAASVGHWINVLRVDPDNKFVHSLLSRVFRVSPKQLKAVSAGTFLYAGLLLTEGTGLLLRKSWAEYFTIISTAALVPLEVYEISRHITAAKLVVLAVNVGIVVYLIIRVKKSRS